MLYSFQCYRGQVMGDTKTPPCTFTTTAIPSRVSLRRAVKAAMAMSCEERLQKVKEAQALLALQWEESCSPKHGSPRSIVRTSLQGENPPTSQPRAFPTTINMV